MTITIAGIAGSLRRDSVNRMLLRAAEQAVPPGARLAVFELLDRVPPFNQDWEGDPAPLAVAELCGLIAAADGLLMTTPEYNASIPGQLKNAVDWTSRPHGSAVLQGKPAAVISASPRRDGAASAAADLRKVLRAAGASVIPAGLSVPRAHVQFTPGGQLADPCLGSQLRTVIGDLIQAATSRHEAA